MPDLQVVFHPDAVEETAAARLWYAGRSQSAADSFLAELDDGIESISEAPERSPQFVHSTRRYLFRRRDNCPDSRTRLRVMYYS